MRLAVAVALACGFVASADAAQSKKPVSAKSETCKEAVGQNQKDLDNALAFCNAAIPKDLGVQAVIAMDSLVWVKVSRPVADYMRKDTLTTEQVVKNWMAAWKKYSGSSAVTVHVEWQDVEIAKGQTTILSGDKVTIH